MTDVAGFSIRHTRFLDAEGRPTQALPPFAHDADHLKALYRGMMLVRTFDAKAVALQRTGRLGTCASSLGQEAVGVGVAAAMRPEDVLVPSFRDQGTQIGRGVTLHEMFLYWGGDERGNVFAGPVEDFPIAVPVGTQAPHAVGIALAFRLRREARAAVCLMGDGATSKGDVYEAMNIAGVWKAPLVFVVNNNQWAISVPRSAQSAAVTLAQKAIAAGFEGEQVDGNDVVAVEHAMRGALERARAGDGPHLIEAICYRLSDHTTADDASRYRDDKSVGARWKEEPVARLRQYLADAHGWGREDEEALIESCRAEVEAAAEAYLATPPEPPEAMFDHLYATLPDALTAERAVMVRGGCSRA